MSRYIWNIHSGFWYFATLAHLTPFYDAKERGITRYWCVDADDTMFMMRVESLCDALREVADHAVQNDIAACSLDMWYSRTRGRHWSLGVLYINDICDFRSLFERCDSRAWMNDFSEIFFNFCLDWYMTWLKNHHLARIETFYIEGAKFIHWGAFLSVFGSGIYHWKEGKLYLFFTKEYYHDEELGTIDIADCIKIVPKRSGKFPPFRNTQYEDFIAKARNDYWTKIHFKHVMPFNKRYIPVEYR